jgi:CRISPR-associated endonuclease/helicase Cas3
MSVVAYGQDEESTEDNEQVWYWYVRARSADDDGSRSAPADELLEDHCAAVSDAASAIASALDAPEIVVRALSVAGSHHDSGKRREVWQRACGNTRFPDVVLAKSKQLHWQALLRYRHELGSIVDLGMSADWRTLPSDVQDLVLHVIAAHHGRARPHFPRDESLDPERPERETGAAVAEIPRRFARLQRRYGRWGLAYLESILRAADAVASEMNIAADTLVESR